MNPTCGDCRAPMRQTWSYLTTAKGCARVPSGLVCTDAACVDRQREQDRADRVARDEAALQAALSSGLIVPDATPEEDRWVR